MPRLLTLALLLALAAPSALAQVPAEFPGLDASPLDIASFNPEREGDAEVMVIYSRPYKKGREIFGGLVPYGEVWRTGANEATMIRLTQDATIGGAEVPAGMYLLYTIPREDRWTVILNKAIGQWGAYNYDEGQDLVRFDVPVTPMERAEPLENFSIVFAEADGGADMVMAWDQTAVVVPVRF